jgi:hypothetical protein
VPFACISAANASAMKRKILAHVGTKAARAAIAGLVLLGVVSTAQAGPVDVTATVLIPLGTGRIIFRSPIIWGAQTISTPLVLQDRPTLSLGPPPGGWAGRPR